jgi:hypothetical protein
VSELQATPALRWEIFKNLIEEILYFLLFFRMRRQVFRAFPASKMKPINSIMTDINILCILMKIGFCVFFFLSNPCTVCSSTVVVLRIDNSFFIGADSLGIFDKSQKHVKVCKIRQVHNTFLTFTGKVIMPDYHFNAFDIASNIFAGKGSIENKIKAYDAIVNRRLIKIVDHIRKDKKKFDSMVTGDKVILTTTITVVTATKPAFYDIEFKVSSTTDEPAVVESIQGGLDEQSGRVAGVDYAIYGEHQNILNFIRKEQFTASFDAVANINQWIGLEAASNPKVGPPIDILRITLGNAEWIQHKPECPEIDKSFFEQ